jgi:hypothetical protein
MIFTNSFHGTVFSIVFKKPFYCFIDTSTSRQKMSSRIYSLVNMLGLNHRIFDSLKPADDTPIDYDSVNSILASSEKKSLNI